jgi:hypothetical protein
VYIYLHTHIFIYIHIAKKVSVEYKKAEEEFRNMRDDFTNSVFCILNNTNSQPGRIPRPHDQSLQQVVLMQCNDLPVPFLSRILTTRVCIRLRRRGTIVALGTCPR